MKKTENDHLLAPRPVDSATKQLEMFRYVYPAKPEAKADDWLAAVRQEREERRTIAAELFPGLEFASDADLTNDQIRAITSAYFDRHPDLRPRSPELEPKKKKDKYFVFTVFWSNPYTEPPNGKPRYLLQIRSEYDRPDAKQQAKIDAVINRNPGYSRDWNDFTDEKVEQSRKWSEERKIANRRRLMEKRVRRRFSIPELAEEEIQRQLMAKPEYFGVEPLKIPLALTSKEMEPALNEPLSRPL